MILHAAIHDRLEQLVECRTQVRPRCPPRRQKIASIHGKLLHGEGQILGEHLFEGCAHALSGFEPLGHPWRLRPGVGNLERKKRAIELHAPIELVEHA